MVKPCMMVVFLPLLSTFIVFYSSNGVMGSPTPQFPAMFVFGDSLVDDGNNNFLNSIAKSNYFPYGIDYYGGPTGRFCNGKTIVDFLGDMVGLPPLPPFTTTTAGGDILRGVNYASAAAGILEESGKNLVTIYIYLNKLRQEGDRFSLRQQAQNFESSLSQLKNQMINEKELSQYLSSSLVVMNFGSNDYLNNYLMPFIYSTSYTYNPKDFADLLIRDYAQQISALHRLGLRKFLLAGIGPLGCIPYQLATGLAPPGNCVSSVNEQVQLFNMRLRTLVDQLNTNHSGSIFVYGNTYGAFNDILNNSATYGFTVIDSGCCGIGRNQGQITCLPLALPCFNRDEYIFWDAYHPTQAFNQIIARRAYNGPPSDCYPVNVKQMAQF